MTTHPLLENAQTPLTRTERLRRVVILCVHFARNLAYHRGASAVPDGWQLSWAEGTGNPLVLEASFWITAHRNSLDICVLEFCKLFCERSGKHCWENVVSDPGAFRLELLRRLQMTEVEYLAYIKAMLRYRNKFVAHLDNERVMNPPNLENALTAVKYYHEHVVNVEAQAGALNGLRDDPRGFERGYLQEIEIASLAYRRVMVPPR
jgi:hypothetical protein